VAQDSDFPILGEVQAGCWPPVAQKMEGTSHSESEMSDLCVVRAGDMGRQSDTP
jgi:hypothetical protein